MKNIAKELVEVAKLIASDYSDYEQKKSEFVRRMRSLRMLSMNPEEKAKKLEEIQKNLDELEKNKPEKPMGYEVYYKDDEDGQYHFEFFIDSTDDAVIKEQLETFEIEMRSGSFFGHSGEHDFDKKKLKLKKVRSIHR
jgi:hypothetical protein